MKDLLCRQSLGVSELTFLEVVPTEEQHGACGDGVAQGTRPHAEASPHAEAQSRAREAIARDSTVFADREPSSLY